MQAFLKVIACKNRLSQRLAVAHGNQMQAIKRLLFRMAPEDDWFCRFMVDLPIPERDDYDFKAQPLRLMNREDTDRILSIRCGNCFPAARFVPPFQETVQSALSFWVYSDTISKKAWTKTCSFSGKSSAKRRNRPSVIS